MFAPTVADWFARGRFVTNAGLAVADALIRLALVTRVAPTDGTCFRMPAIIHRVAHRMGK